MKKVYTEADINKIVNDGERVLNISQHDILTPSAKDIIQQYNIAVNIIKAEPIKEFIDNSKAHLAKGKIAIGGDHTGFAAKNLLIKYLEDKDYLIVDVGTFSEKSCDYPDYAIEVSKKINLNQADYGILLDATGIPSAITANKFPGIRAATCYNEFSAKSAREHNNANILVMGAKTLGEETIKSIVDKFLATKFGGERHQRRLDKITEVEKTFSK